MSVLKLLVLSYEYPPLGGGGGIMIKNLIQRLNTNDFKTTIITTWYENLPEYEIVNEVEIHRVKSLRKKEWQSNPIEMLSWVNKTKQKAEEIISNSTFDLVISNFVLPGGLVAYFLRKKFNLPYICISHGHDIPWVKPYSLYPLFFITQWKIKKIIKKSKGTITLSDELKTNAIKFIGQPYQHLIHKIPNGYDHELFYPRTKVAHEIPKLLFVGRLVSQKGIKTLLKIARKLKQQIQFELIIVGDGPKRKYMENFCKKNSLYPECVFLGKINQNELAEIYANSDLLIAPSVSEGMSLSIIEAIGCNLHVVTSEVSGVTEIVNSTEKGFIVKRNNYKDFTNYIFYYLNINHCCKLNVNSCNNISYQKLENWEIIANKYTNFLNNLNLAKL